MTRTNPCLNKGFSLVELITVITLIGVLAVVAGTRLQSRQGYVEYAYQDRLVSALRNMQIRAMQDTRDGFCFRLNFQYGASSAYGPPSLDYAPGNGNAPAFLATVGTELTDEGLSLSSADGALINFSYIGFDALGRPLNNAANCGTGSPCRVTITGESSVDVCIESEGYIHAC